MTITWTDIQIPNRLLMTMNQVVGVDSSACDYAIHMILRAMGMLPGTALHEERWSMVRSTLSHVRITIAHRCAWEEVQSAAAARFSDPDAHGLDRRWMIWGKSLDLTPLSQSAPPVCDVGATVHLSTTMIPEITMSWNGRNAVTVSKAIVQAKKWNKSIPFSTVRDGCVWFSEKKWHREPSIRLHKVHVVDVSEQPCVRSMDGRKVSFTAPIVRTQAIADIIDVAGFSELICSGIGGHKGFGHGLIRVSLP
jgi:hypothetical protein